MFERSKWDFGVASVTRDGILYGLGYTREEVKKPYIAVVNSWNEYNPGHIHLKELAQRVKDGIREAGGLHRFMSWPKPILTDSGGFQVFSL